MIVITGRMKVDPSLVREFAADLRAGIPAALAEDGCLFYSFALEDEAAGTVLAVERWRDEAALAQHFTQPAVAALVAKWGHRAEFAVVKHDAENERAMM